MKKKLLTLLSSVFFCGVTYALDAPTLLSPADSLKTSVCRIQFGWSVVSGAKYYCLEVDTTKTFDSPISRRFEDLTTTNSYWMYYTVYDLYYGQQYYWRVKTFNSDKSEESAWSSAWMFTTPNIVTLSKDDAPSPTGNFYPEQTLFWKSIRGSSGYHIEWDTVPTFNSTAYQKNTYTIKQTDEETQLNCVISNLYFNRMYYWRVRAYNKVDTTVWSETRRFHTLTKMKQSSPDNEATSIRVDPTLYWNSNYMDYGIKKVQVQIDTVPTFDSPFFEQETSTGDGYKFTDVPFYKTIYWRIRGIHSKDTTEWSDTWSFTTFRGASLSSPSDSATGIITWPSLFCNEHNGVRAYHFQLDTAATFDSPLLREQKNSDREFEPKFLNFGTTYYWRVRDCHKRDTSMWTPARCFTTYYRGALSSPANGAMEISLKPTLRVSFRTGVSYYQIQVDSLPTFDSPGRIDTLAKITDTYYNYCDLKTSLDRGTTYYWRVRECHQNDTSLWSNVWTFTTASTVSIPVLKAPAADSEHPCDRIAFSWHQVANAGQYTLETDTSEWFNSPARRVVTTSDSAANITNLLPEEHYLWRVRAFSKADASIHSAWSEVRAFTTTKMVPLDLTKSLSFCEGDSAEYRGKWYHTAVTDIIHAEGVTRDTTITVTVTVKQPTTAQETKTITVGDAGTWRGHDLSEYAVGKYELKDTTTNAAGCEHIITLLLTVNKLATYKETKELTFCEGDSEEYRGVVYDKAGTYTLNIPGATCDTTITVIVTVNKNTYSELNQTVMAGDVVALPAGEWHLGEAVYTDSYQTQETDTENLIFTQFGTTPQGCDAITKLFVTVEPKIVTAVPTLNAQTEHSKILRNGQLLILHKGKTFTAFGAEVE